MPDGLHPDYFRHIRLLKIVLIGAPGTIRTCGTRIRNPVLYPLSYGGKNGKIDRVVCPVLANCGFCSAIPAELYLAKKPAHLGNGFNLLHILDGTLK